mmetsp:Transcript_38831/g.91348  ORF Transcript_38831/g.91348 Transcript_38831/m.91348 type:complete len:623 (+) Transcript_38831:140-2008(+)|eukprot:CAMPEP_0178410322 /NCGR_PEP_ID=MMETSP0689_2-20121128/20919_1 /TAXON_ID=160604 /ORGANISM="Amphidinium massartii, Strain CS-259" /LENGTH=622 /DNA_ID=CAMNT_0020031493 /DNA_START=69 /DNA_END=1937 /DNA_ORIENTATION=+
MVQKKVAAKEQQIANAATGPAIVKRTGILANVNAGPGRIANAVDLRAAYIEVKQSPDGVDPEPLTVPRCVECANCGWPVYPRESKVATKKTYERAGIIRVERKEKKEDEEAGEEQEDDADSVATEDRLRDKLEDMEEQYRDLQDELEETKKERDNLSAKLTDTEDQLAKANDKIDFLEASEIRWREKCSALRVENEKLKLFCNEQGAKIGDLETDMCRKLVDIRTAKEKFAKFARRRNLMLELFGKSLRKKEHVTLLELLMRLWHGVARGSTSRKRLEDLEARRRREVAGLQEACEMEQVRLAHANREASRLSHFLRAAGHRLLLRSACGMVFPFALAHAFRTWVAAKQLQKSEDVLELVRQELEHTQGQYQGQQHQSKMLDQELKMVAIQRDELDAERQQLHREIGNLSGEVAARKGDAAKAKAMKAEEIERLGEQKARQLLIDLEARLNAEHTELFEKATKEWEEQKASLEEELSVARFAGAAVGAGSISKATKAESEVNRVVPKGQGILCCGCLKQIVHRTVKPLPPLAALKCAPERLEQTKRHFFKSELQGMPDPDDALHTYVWASHKDPSGVALSRRGGGLPSPSSTRARSAVDLPFRLGAGIDRGLAAEFRPVSFR